MAILAAIAPYTYQGSVIFDHLKDPLRDLINGQVPIDRHQAAFPLVIVSHRSGLNVVRLQTLTYDILLIIMTSDQLGAINITEFVNAGTLRVDVIRTPTGGTRTTAGDPTYQLIIIDVEADHNRQTLAVV